MEDRKNIIKQYFESWIKKDINIIEKYFSENIKYIESYGQEYNGINQIRKWFKDWNNGNSVLKWDIKRFIENDNTIIVEWYFECEYDKNISSFDGVSIIEFDDNNKINLVKEFHAKTEHISQYNWDIKRYVKNNNTIIIEWFSECEHDKNINNFDCVTIIEYDDNNEIISIKGFQSKTEHIFPYNEEKKETF